jgi:DNA-binding MarR family transcriptional regulator
MVARAGVQLTPAAAWLIVRLSENHAADVDALSRQFDIPEAVASAALVELGQRGFVADVNGAREVTPAGEDTAGRLVEERRATLARLCEHWDPDLHPELADVVHRLAHELAREPARELAGAGA